MANLPVPTPRTFTVAEFETAAYFNANVRDLGNFLLNTPLASVFQAVSQSLTANTWTPLTFDSTTTDGYGTHSNTVNSSRCTAQVAGWYECSGAACTTSAQTTGWRSGIFQVNGTRYQGSASDLAASGNFTTVPVPTTPIYLNVGDYVELAAYSSVATSTTVLTDLCSRMSIRWVHA